MFKFVPWLVNSIWPTYLDKIEFDHIFTQNNFLEIWTKYY